MTCTESVVVHRNETLETMETMWSRWEATSLRKKVDVDVQQLLRTVTLVSFVFHVNLTQSKRRYRDHAQGEE